MIDKGNCKACGRKIQETLHDTCLYCGCELSEEQKFTAEEKQAIRVYSEHQAKLAELRRQADDQYRCVMNKDRYSGWEDF